MRLYAAYFSPTGGTKKALDALCHAWDCERVELDLAESMPDTAGLEFGAEDVLVVAVPSFSGRVPQFLIPKLGTMRGNGAAALLVTAYGNRDFDDTLIELKNVLEPAGFRCMCAVAAVTQHSLMPAYGTGRPDAQDIAELSAFSERCRRAIETGKPAEIPGNVPYREYTGVPLKPEADKRCTACGLCARSCPLGAIPEQDPRTVDKARCISCMLCTAVCPQNARKVNTLMQHAAQLKMKKLCAGRKENHLFCAE